MSKLHKSGCDHVVRTAPPLVADERSRHKRPLSLRSRTRTAIPAQTERRANGLFSGENGAFQAQFYRRPLSLNSDKAVCGTAGALLRVSAKALLPEFRGFRRTALQKSANPFRAFYGITDSSAFCAVPAASVRFSVDSPRFPAFCSGFPRTSPVFCAVPGFRG